MFVTRTPTRDLFAVDNRLVLSTEVAAYRVGHLGCTWSSV